MLLKVNQMTSSNYTQKYFKKRPMFTMTNAAAFTMRDKEIRCCNDPSVLVSIPEYNRIVGNTDGIDNTRFERLMITLKEPYNYDHVQKVKLAITESFTENQSRLMRFYDY